MAGKAIDVDSLSEVESDNFEDEEVEWLDLDEKGDEVVGEILEISEDVGDWDSRIYKLESPDHDVPVVFWGKRSIDGKVDRAAAGDGLESGDVLFVRNTGETYETKNGRGTEYQVKYEKR
jgi:hypothetical protein